MNDSIHSNYSNKHEIRTQKKDSVYFFIFFFFRFLQIYLLTFGNSETNDCAFSTHMDDI